jgi:NhaP-type Na+/H+ or K+/H+ antiporter
MMSISLTNNPALTIALAMAAGMIAQAVARHLRMPGIVLLIVTGVVLGPDGLGIVQPHSLADGLHTLIGFAVAVILFEGGLNLNIRRIREQAGPIQRLLTLGVVITAGGGALAARLFLHWDWRLAALFGTLVIVTGPTVITPLLRRIRVRKKIETLLETEGVLVDAVGTIIAVVALELAIGPTGSALTQGLLSAPARLAFGTFIGLIGGAILAIMLKKRPVVPEGLDNIFTLAMVLALFQVSNSFMAETGIVAVITAGIVIGNVRGIEQRELREFKEQLTVLLIGLLFVLLAADIHVRDVTALGGPGIATVLALMFLVRPANILACTWGAGFTWRDKAFMSWVAPRGIIAAAISSLFGSRLAEAGIAGGDQLQALVFLVIAATVFVQGATAEFLAVLLGVRRPKGQGYAILGANPLGRTLGRLLQQAGHPVLLIDAGASGNQGLPEENFTVIVGNALDERVLIQADIESRRAVIGLSPNGAVNLLFARKAKHEFKVPAAYIGIQRGFGAINANLVHEAGGTVLFAEERDLELWAVRIRRGTCSIQTWEFKNEVTEHEHENKRSVRLDRNVRNSLLPLVHKHGKNIKPVDDGSRITSGDILTWLIFDERENEAATWLKKQGWHRTEETEVSRNGTPPTKN